MTVDSAMTKPSHQHRHDGLGIQREEIRVELFTAKDIDDAAMPWQALLLSANRTFAAQAEDPW